MAFFTTAQAQVFTQQGSKLVGTPNNAAQQGWSVALSADGNTALVGGNKDSSNAGAVWVFVRDNSGNWTQQSKLVSDEPTAPVQFGYAVALSGDGNTALIGGPLDSSSAGAAWVFTRSSGNWTQQGSKLVGSGAVGGAQQGSSVALSADGNTALVGGYGDNSSTGAAWIFIRSNGAWSQVGNKLVSAADVGAQQGYSVALSGNGNTALIGAPMDGGGVGAGFIFTNSGGTWTQGSKLSVSNGGQQGYSVALSGDGNTALLGGPGLNSMAGAVWVFANSGGNWTQQATLTGSGAPAGARQGTSVALSNDGNTALFGGPGGSGNNAWVFTRNGSTWSQAGSELVGSGSVGVPTAGQSVALSADGNTALIGGNSDNEISAGSYVGAAWPFTRALSESLQFVPIAPCRVADTRNATGPFGGPEISGQSTRTFNIPSSACSIPSSAAAYSLNVTVVPDGPLGYVTVWPTGQSQPTVSTLNSLDGRTKANAAIMPAGSDGSINVFASNGTQLVLDIDGYFIPASASTLAFYPLTPCRVVDTRSGSGQLAGPYLTGGVARSFPIQSSQCSIPSTAQAYSLNMTVVPHTALGYLTVWPTGETQPYVSTLNSLTATTVANAAIVPAGSNGGEISVFASNDTDLVIDANGYFAPASSGSGGLSLYALTPCRALDTRTSSGQFTGELTVNIGSGSCGTLTSTAQAFVLNATVVPPSPLGYLTLWPDGKLQPVVSTLNAIDAAVTSNMAIVPTTNGSIDVFASNPTQLVLDLTGFFAP